MRFRHISAPLTTVTVNRQRRQAVVTHAYTHTVSRSMLMRSPGFSCCDCSVVFGRSLQCHLSNVTCSHTNTLPETVRYALLHTERSIISKICVTSHKPQQTRDDFLESEPDLQSSLTSSGQTHTHYKLVFHVLCF